MSLTYNPYMYQHHCILKSQTSRWDANFPTTSEEFYAYGLYQTELFDYSKAFDAFLKARDLKSIKALFMLGRCYQSGLGTSQSMDTAVSFFSAYCEETLKLISMGTSLSEEQNYHLGYCYLYGLGLAFDAQKAYDLLLQSSNHFALSCHELGNMMQQGCEHFLQDLTQASKW
ncbi:MAG: sel1 repeat family protein, partial [Clostridiales bacterium]|nr:sel1 repeat family protein [Clostridiales bacterium]